MNEIADPYTADYPLFSIDWLRFWYRSHAIASPPPPALPPWIPPNASSETFPQNAQSEPIILLPVIPFDDQSDQAGRRVKQSALSPPDLLLAPPQLLLHANGTGGRARKCGAVKQWNGLSW